MNTRSSTATATRTQAGVNLSLGTVGRLESFHVSTLFGRSCHWDRSIVLAEAHSRLPRPGYELDCTVLQAPQGTPLIVVAARHHDVAYYVISNLAERGSWNAFKRVLRTRRLELGLTTDGVKPFWTSLHFEDKAAEQLQARLRETGKSWWRGAGDTWRDQLGLLLLNLPQQLAALQPHAPACVAHAAVLASGDCAKHSASRQRCLDAARAAETGAD